MLLRYWHVCTVCIGMLLRYMISIRNIYVTPPLINNGNAYIYRRPLFYLGSKRVIMFNKIFDSITLGTDVKLEVTKFLFFVTLELLSNCKNGGKLDSSEENSKKNLKLKLAYFLNC